MGKSSGDNCIMIPVKGYSESYALEFSANATSAEKNRTAK